MYCNKLNHTYGHHWLLWCYSDGTLTATPFGNTKIELPTYCCSNINWHQAPITHSCFAASWSAGAFEANSDVPLLPILNTNNLPLSQGAFKVKIPATLTTTLPSYVMKHHIQEMCCDVFLPTSLLGLDGHRVCL